MEVCVYLAISDNGKVLFPCRDSETGTCGTWACTSSISLWQPFQHLTISSECLPVSSLTRKLKIPVFKTQPEGRQGEKKKSHGKWKFEQWSTRYSFNNYHH